MIQGSHKYFFLSSDGLVMIPKVPQEKLVHVEAEFGGFIF